MSKKDKAEGRLSKKKVITQLQVIALNYVNGTVLVHLHPYNPIPKEEIERAITKANLEKLQPSVSDEEEMIKKILGPVSKDKDEAMMQKFISIYRKEMPELFEILKNPPFASSGVNTVMARLEPLPISQDLILTMDQYRELGSPPLFAILDLTLTSYMDNSVKPHYGYDFSGRGYTGKPHPKNKADKLPPE